MRSSVWLRTALLVQAAAAAVLLTADSPPPPTPAHSPTDPTTPEMAADVLPAVETPPPPQPSPASELSPPPPQPSPASELSPPPPQPSPASELSPPPPQPSPASEWTPPPPQPSPASELTPPPPRPSPTSELSPPPTLHFDWTTLLPSHPVYIALVDGGNLRITFGPDDLRIVCQSDASLDGSLPRLQPPRRDRAVSVTCPPPAAGYRSALARLAVELAPDAHLTLHLGPGGAPLAAAHLADLHFTNLTLLAAAGGGRAPPTPRADLLRGRRLQRLAVNYVPLGARALDVLEPPLRTLVLFSTRPVRVPRALSATLEYLVARRGEVRLEGAAGSLRQLTLDLPREQAEPPPLAGFPVLSILSVTNWNSKSPRPLLDCGSLQSLALTNPTFVELPTGWVAACGALRSLAVHSAKGLTSLPAGLLQGAAGLTHLEWRSGALSSLPDRVFESVPRLTHLDLTNNKLTALSTNIFSGVVSLEVLNLSKNKLDAAVLLAVGKLTALQVLVLASNARLGDSCSGGRYSNTGMSRLSALKKLTKLDLSYTNVTRICRDWRLGMPLLGDLSLVKTNITSLKYEDFEYTRSPQTAAPFVDLVGADVSTVEYSAADEELAASAAPARVEVRLSSDLLCDCNTFRAARAFRAHAHHARLVRPLDHVRCKAAPELTPASGKLASVPLDDMLCVLPLAGLESRAACRVWQREQDGLWRHRVRVACAAAGLTRLPPSLSSVQNANVSWDLRLSGNNISSLAGLPAGELELDLRNNTIEHFSAADMSALTAADVKVLRLEGNPLDCSCSPEAAPLLRAVVVAAPLRPALDHALCSDGRELAQAADERSAACRPPPTTGAAGHVALLAALGVLVPLALAAAAVSAAVSRPARRARFKALLLRWGWLPRPEEGDDGRPYDAFVSYAHEDEQFALRVAERLEAGPRGLRLCLHERDWSPGEYIGAQIAASVRDSRRTLVLVSRAFLRSQWARAEFREAAGAAARDPHPRLVLVLLEPPAALPLDRELRHYVATNTYLLATHPRFWERLRDAMPPPRAPDPPPHAPDPPPHVSSDKTARTAVPPPPTLAIAKSHIPPVSHSANSWSPDLAQITCDDQQKVCELSKDTSSGYSSSWSSGSGACPSPPAVAAAAAAAVRWAEPPRTARSAPMPA